MDEFLLPEKQIDNIIDLALAEDISHGDITSEVLIPNDLSGKASVLVKENGVFAGGEVARRVFHRVDPLLTVELLIEDGSAVQPGDVAASIIGTVSCDVRGII